MKNLIYIVIALFLSVSAQAQIDRTQQPKPGPAPKVNIAKPHSFTLPNGLKVLVVENHKLPRVSINLGLDNAPSIEGDKKGVFDLASSMFGNGTSKISKDDFNEQIDYLGARISFNINFVGANALSRYFPQVLNLVAQGSLDPIFTQEELNSERAKLLDGLKIDEKSPQSVARNVSGPLFFGKNHPAGELLMPATINNVTLEDIKAYYKSFFVPENAYLVIVGDVKFDEVKKLVTKSFSSWKKANAPKSVYPEAVAIGKREINFVDMPNAVQSEIYVGNITNLKMTDSDYFATLLANHILGGGGEGRLFLNLREAHGWTYGAYSNIRGDKRTSTFKASTSVRNAVTDSAVVEMLSEIQKISAKPVSLDELNLAKAKFVGSFVMQVEKPSTIAQFAINEKAQSLPAGFYENYIKSVNAVTLEEVQAAAQKYFTPEALRILVVGKGTDVVPNLETLNYPISYFDIYGNPTSKPEAAKISTDITPNSILTKYIDAIGGKKRLQEVKTMVVIAKGSVQGQELTITKKIADGEKSVQEVSVMSMTMSKSVFNGKTGYMMMNGQKKELSGTELEDVKDVPFRELNLLNSDIKLDGIENIDGNDSYKLVKGNKAYFYDVKTGLKVAEELSREVSPGKMISQRVGYSDYKEVDGIKTPHTMTLNVGMEVKLTVTEVKFNAGVSDNDFN